MSSNLFPGTMQYQPHLSYSVTGVNPQTSTEVLINQYVRLSQLVDQQRRAAEEAGQRYANAGFCHGYPQGMIIPQQDLERTKALLYGIYNELQIRFRQPPDVASPHQQNVALNQVSERVDQLSRQVLAQQAQIAALQEELAALQEELKALRAHVFPQ